MVDQSGTQTQDPQQYVAQAQEQVAHFRQTTQEVAEANRSLIQASAEATEDTFTGQATFTTAFIYGRTTAMSPHTMAPGSTSKVHTGE